MTFDRWRAFLCSGSPSRDGDHFFQWQLSDKFPWERGEASSVRMRSVVIWRLSAVDVSRYRSIEGHRCSTERDADSLREGPSPARLNPFTRRGATGSAGQGSGGLHAPGPLLRCSQRRECGLLKSRGRCMALPGDAMKIRTADWETAAPRYHRHGGGGGGGERWILVERSTLGSVSEEPRRAERLCCTV